MRPSLRATGIALALALLAFPLIFFPGLRDLWLKVALAACGAGILDALLVLTFRKPVLHRRAEVVGIQGRAMEVVLQVQLVWPSFRPVTVHDGISGDMDAPDLPLVLRPKASETRDGPFLEGRYRMVPLLRGSLEFSPAWMEKPGFLGLWIRRWRSGPVQPVRVHPALGAHRDGSMSLGGEAMAAAGLHNIRRRGQGLEFHQLREYRQGDSLRLVDPGASSRMGRYIVKELQEEEDQTVVFLLDTGFRMLDTDGVRSHFDAAFAAMLDLAWVALRQGDRVGVRTWGPDARWIPPRRGRDSFPDLVGRLHDLHASGGSGSPSEALQELLSRLDRRSLVVMLGNFREEDRDEVTRLAALLGRRHLVLTVWLQEPEVRHMASRVPAHRDEALETIMADSFLRERERCRKIQESRGIITLDTPPDRLGPRLVQAYWDTKKKGLL